MLIVCRGTRRATRISCLSETCLPAMRRSSCWFSVYHNNDIIRRPKTAHCKSKVRDFTMTQTQPCLANAPIITFETHASLELSLTLVTFEKIMRRRCDESHEWGARRASGLHCSRIRKVAPIPFGSTSGGGGRCCVPRRGEVPLYRHFRGLFQLFGYSWAATTVLGNVPLRHRMCRQNHSKSAAV